MTGDKTIAPEINITNNWHIIPTSGDLLANDTNDLAHFLSLHPFGSWPPKAPPRSNLQILAHQNFPRVVPPTFFATSVLRQADLDSSGNRTAAAIV
eukprot:CAMPEP_0179445192 /NCGR_PEP_ID=MMETSP0799-20121207/28645_1 /TAXON_ID=46947 /ORGANISM="Geminigera cryophila, Strain CCMP2564" /LENGTH=95 /DNA_ID=CAMNT_0021233003 /DNA_START=161 /DNA_END=449 /DNA_ORIENTATION=+